jgi:hypothetical protein
MPGKRADMNDLSTTSDGFSFFPPWKAVQVAVKKYAKKHAWSADRETRTHHEETPHRFEHHLASIGSRGSDATNRAGYSHQRSKARPRQTHARTLPPKRPKQPTNLNMARSGHGKPFYRTSQNTLKSSFQCMVCCKAMSDSVTPQKSCPSPSEN